MSQSEPKYDFLDPPQRDGEIGRLGPYRVKKLLGRGGMGQVFHAVDSRLKRNVALKVMSSRIAAAKNSRRRFLEEARSMAAIHHENVVLVFEVGERNDTPFLAMELLKGKSLYQRRQEGWMFSDEEIIELGKQLSRGLGAAHECGIIHRDIKPGNIWIEEPSGRVKILDFGLAVAGEGIDRFSGRGSVVGSPGYLAPEQARDDPLDDRTDLYSLGVVLYELCVSRLPSVATTMPGQLLAILAHEPTPILELNPDVKPELADVIHCLLSKESRDRPNDAAHLEAMLEYAAEAPVAPTTSEQSVTEQPVTEQPVSEQPVVVDATPIDPPIAQVVRTVDPASAAPVVAIQRESRPTKPKKKSKRSKTVAKSTETDSPRVQQNKSRLPLILTALTSLIAVGVVGYLVWSPKVTSREPLAEEIVSRPKQQVFKVVPQTLKPFQFTDVSADTKDVKLGNALQVKVTIKNEATDRATDPRVVNFKAKDIAVLAAFAKQGESLEELVDQRKMRPRDMPAAGAEKPFTMSVWTRELSEGPCNVFFRLQSPDGQTISEISEQITIRK